MHRGTVFFEEGGGTVTVTSNRHYEMLENFLRPKLAEYEKTDVFWFQQLHRPFGPSLLSHFVRNIFWSSYILTLHGLLTLLICTLVISFYKKLKFLNIVLVSWKNSNRPNVKKTHRNSTQLAGGVMKNFQKLLHMYVTRHGYHLNDIFFEE